jgi:hypothetical protein
MSTDYLLLLPPHLVHDQACLALQLALQPAPQAPALLLSRRTTLASNTSLLQRAAAAATAASGQPLQLCTCTMSKLYAEEHTGAQM